MPVLTPPLASGDHDPADEALTLPAEHTLPRRPGVPVLATLVPILGAVAMWLVTGSVLSLWLTLLGPLIAGATVVDGLRSARRERRRAAVERDAAHARVAAAIAARHERERQRRRTRHPDVAGYIAREAEIWRAVPGRGEVLVLGHGDVPSILQVTGGGSQAESVALRSRARVLHDSPVVVPASAGIVVVGTPPLVAAVARALVLQACLANPPGELRVIATPQADEHWLSVLPHRDAAAPSTLALVARGDAVPVEADMAVFGVGPEEPLPPGCGAVLVVHSPGRARLDAGGEVRELNPEAISRAQAEHIAQVLAARAGQLAGGAASADRIVALSSLLSGAPSEGLAAVIGLEGKAPAIVDLVADGPHAVVAGMTGSGKSELLVSWVLALCATRSPRDVSFLLADFKGGTAFDGLAALPHVTGVITDLDGSGARRAIQSLRAEVRWRESELARVGARDILDPRVELPRLVVVVDEFAALLGEHPELHAVFTDIAARGRALGMHLVLGTQRVAGVVRDALLSNCPLRVSLRVADPADSRGVIGTDDAARLPGGDAGRGLALVRRGADPIARRVQVALSAPADIVAIAATKEAHRPRRPWLPDLPPHIELDELLANGGRPGEILLGLADEPDRQRQVAVGVRIEDRGLLVVGAAGTGKSSALRTIAVQSATPIVFPHDPERAWDLLVELDEAPPRPGSTIIIDDLDALGTRFPHDYAAELMERVERLARGAGDRGLLVVASAQRLGGTAARIAELLPRRVLLGAPSRAEYIALGGEAVHHIPNQTPGRARIDGRAVQIAVPPPSPAAERIADPPTWYPGDGLTGFVARRSGASRAVIAEWERSGARIVGVADAAADTTPGLGSSGSSAGVRAPEWHHSRALIVGDADDWQRNRHLLGTIRDGHALVIDTSAAADFRMLSGDRALPPFCAPGKARAWLCQDGRPAQRIALPRAADSRG